jgi:FkbM family methyltransferase
MVARWRRALLGNRVAAGVEHTRILRNLGPIRRVVDIGANRGQFALVARNEYPEARIVSFEPLAGPAEVFQKVFRGDENIRLVQAAIGPEQGEVPIHISARDDSSSLLPISNRQSETFSGTEEVGTATIQVGPLDSFVAAEELESPALLKLDVQGYEYQALQGCESLLRRFTYVYCECSFVELYSGQKLAADVMAWLAARGFRLQGMYNAFYDHQGVAIQADFLFVQGEQPV